MLGSFVTVPQHTTPQGRSLNRLLRQLSAPRFAVVNGAAADTNITLPGYSREAGDVIAFAGYLPIADVGDANAITDLDDVTDELKAGSTDSTFQLETTVTTGGRLLVVWYDTPAL